MYKALIILFISSLLMGEHPINLIRIKGILTTKNGDAIPGCNVVIKGGTQSVSTDVCGEFEFEVKETYEGVLVFACMTYRVWEIKVDKFKSNDVTILCLVDWRNFENGTCTITYSKEKRIKVK